MAAERLAAAGCAVTVYEAMPSPGRKLLMAGRGGLNLTHSEPLETFLARYGGEAHRITEAVRHFPPEALIAWANGLGQETFVGSSGRVFPRLFKSSPLLRAWLGRLAELGVAIRPRHRWTGWDGDDAIAITDGTGQRSVMRPDAVVLALGGASWPRLGSDGAWVELLAQRGIAVTPLAPANAGVAIAWSRHIVPRCEGMPLKRIAVACGPARARGEAIITRSGLEGGAIYAVGREIRSALVLGRPARIFLDLRPDIAEDALARRLDVRRGKATVTSFLRKRAGLSPAHIAIAREAAQGTLPATADGLASAIKHAGLDVHATSGLARAISTAGGVRLDAVDKNLMLLVRPGVFVAGEMLDWEAPTGGYLLQAALATGALAADGVLRWLARR